jgi:prepilin-type processing-associated H-X9-DG protein
MTNAGAIDYIATIQVQQRLAQVFYPGVTDDLNSWGVGGAVIAGQTTGNGYLPKGEKISYISDGTSNTVMLGEMVGRNSLYYTGNILQSTSSPVDEAGWQQVWGGGAWADPLNGQWKLIGTNSNGTFNYSGGGSPLPGNCFVNCSNSRSAAQGGGGDPEQYSACLYSFHTGGAQIVMCDGSVRFLSANINAATFVAIISANNGEVVGDF